MSTFGEQFSSIAAYLENVTVVREGKTLVSDPSGGLYEIDYIRPGESVKILVNTPCNLFVDGQVRPFELRANIANELIWPSNGVSPFLIVGIVAAALGAFILLRKKR